MTEAAHRPQAEVFRHERPAQRRRLYAWYRPVGVRTAYLIVLLAAAGTTTSASSTAVGASAATNEAGPARGLDSNSVNSRSIAPRAAPSTAEARQNQTIGTDNPARAVDGTAGGMGSGPAGNSGTGDGDRVQDPGR